MGDPCTGQLKLWDEAFVTIIKGGIRLDNFGPDPPTGSKIITEFYAGCLPLLQLLL